MKVKEIKKTSFALNIGKKEKIKTMVVVCGRGFTLTLTTTNL